MNTIIIDDEPLAREGLELYLQKLPNVTLVGQFSNALEANDLITQNEVDLILLDIEMSGINGMDFIRTLKKQPMIIMTTAYPEYALEGFELDVVDYLIKPIRLERFIKAINKAQEIFTLKNNAPAAVESIESDYIYIKSERKFVRLFYKDILYIKGMKDYVMIYSSDNKKLMTAMNLGTITKQLPPEIFVRVSKSHLININFIDAVETDLIQLAGEEIPLGRTYREHFVENYIKKNLIGR